MTLKRGSGTFSYYELLDMCAQPACPICNLGNKSASRHLRSFIYDGVNNVPLRAHLRDALGYCHEHAWMLPEAGESAPLGIAILHRDLLNSIRQRLDKSQFNKSGKRSLRSMLSGALKRGEGYAKSGNPPQYLAETGICPACERRIEAENLAFKALMEALNKDDAPMIAALKNSDGLCLVHLRYALEIADTPEVFDHLVTITGGQLSTLIADLDEFIRKNDHRFRDEKISDSERASWKKGLQRLVGPQTDPPE